MKNCLVCDKSIFDVIYPANFDGGWQDAIPYFLTNRAKAVHGNIVKCRNCNFVFTNPQYTPEEYQNIYKNIKNYKDTEKLSEKRFARLKAVVTRYCPKGELLDLGCGDGQFMNLMKPDFKCRGIELAGEERISRNRDDIYHGNFQKIVCSENPSWASKFDVVTAWDFFEHVPELNDYLESILYILKKGGWLFCTIPNISSLTALLTGEKWNCLLLEHLWYFSPKTFRAYVNNFGINLHETLPFPYHVDMGTILKRLHQTYRLPLPKTLPEIIHNQIISLPIGLMLCVCQKTTDDIESKI